MKQRVIGTGLSGLIGSRVAELTSDTYDWVGLSLEDGFDLTDEAAVKKRIGEESGDVVFHLAAFTNVDEAWAQDGDKDGSCYRVNVVGTQNVARACKEFNKYLVHVSTEYVFSGNSRDLYTEESKPDATDWYGKTKLWAEEAVQKSGCKFAIVRPALPFRAVFDTKPDVLRKILAGLEAGTLRPMFNDTTITPTFIDDFAAAVDAVITKRPAGIFNTVGSTPVSPYELACKVAAEFDYDVGKVQASSYAEYIKNPGARPYPQHLGVSNAKLKRELGVTMHELDAALKLVHKQMTAAKNAVKA